MMGVTRPQGPFKNDSFATRGFQTLLIVKSSIDLQTSPRLAGCYTGGGPDPRRPGAVHQGGGGGEGVGLAVLSVAKHLPLLPTFTCGESPLKSPLLLD